MHLTSEQTRNATFFVLVAFFAVSLALFTLSARPIGGTFSVIVVPGIGLGLLGTLLVVLTVRLHEARLRRTFFVLAGASAAAIPICVLLHNLVYGLFKLWFGEGFWASHGADEGFFFILALVVCPALFLVGAMGSTVLLMRARLVKQRST
jgi:hypothetical protein